MKKIFFLLFFLSIKIYSQNYEGLLIYTVKNENIENEKTEKILDIIISQGKIPNDTIKVFYSKKGDYVTLFEHNKINHFSIYKIKKNTIYTFDTLLNIVTEKDAGIDLEEELGNIPIVTLLKDKVKIKDYVCSIVEIKWKTGTYKYYFSSEFLKINPEIFKNHRYDQWYEYLKIAKSLPIRIEKQINKFYKQTWDLYLSVETELDKSIFKVPI